MRGAPVWVKLARPDRGRFAATTVGRLTLVTRRPAVEPGAGRAIQRTPLDPTLLAILRCPRCSTDGSFEGTRTAVCRTCGLELPRDEDGYLDLLDHDRRGEPTAATAEQRLMESALVARVYERLWRPTFVRMLAGRGAGAAVGGMTGEVFIHKHALGLDDREGPWLDLSCATGLFVRAMAAAAPTALVVGLDISRAMLEVAEKRSRGYGNVTLVRGDAHALPFADGAF